MGVVSFLGRIGSMIAPFTATVVSIDFLYTAQAYTLCSITQIEHR